MKKILIFYGSYGGGHLSAAKSIRSYLEEKYPDIKVDMVDCIEYINKYVNKVTTGAYKEMAKKAPWAWKQLYKDSKDGALAKISTTSNKVMAHKLNVYIEEFAPDLIISTHPFSTQMCGFLKKKNKLHCKIATILTDFQIHEQWLEFSEFQDYFFVSNEQMRTDMVNAGVNGTKVYVTGIPVSERFLGNYDRKKVIEEYGLNTDN